MSIQNYNGDTFVAFVDISGFKKLMKEGKARDTLNCFYDTGHKILYNPNSNGNQVEGILISDCAVLFVRNNQDRSNQANDLDSILKVIKEISQIMIKNEIMLTTSIAYGKFEYQDRTVYNRTTKNFIYGDAYLNAYLDNETGKPKIRSGECRLVKDHLPEDIFDDIRFKTVLNEDKHYYYYWMVSTPDKIQIFKEKYEDTYSLTSARSLKYAKMIEILKHCILENQT